MLSEDEKDFRRARDLYTEQAICVVNVEHLCETGRNCDGETLRVTLEMTPREHISGLMGDLSSCE